MVVRLQQLAKSGVLKADALEGPASSASAATTVQPASGTLHQPASSTQKVPGEENGCSNQEGGGKNGSSWMRCCFSKPIK